MQKQIEAVIRPLAMKFARELLAAAGKLGTASPSSSPPRLLDKAVLRFLERPRRIGKVMDRFGLNRNQAHVVLARLRGEERVALSGEKRLAVWVVKPVVAAKSRGVANKKSRRK